jgi:transposase
VNLLTLLCQKPLLPTKRKIWNIFILETQFYFTNSNIGLLKGILIYFRENDDVETCLKRLNKKLIRIKKRRNKIVKSIESFRFINSS